MFFAAALFIQLLLYWVELHVRAQSQRSPKNFQEFWALLSKARSPDKKFTTMAFVLSAMACFCFWEAALRVTLDHEVPWWVAVFGLAAGAILLSRRAVAGKAEFLKWSRADFLLLWLLWGLCWGPYVALLCAPWYAYRMQLYLKTTS